MRLLLIFILLFSWPVYGQKKECECTKYLTGNFYMFGPDGNTNDTLYIKRTATAQTERLGEDYNQKHELAWLSPCKYILQDSRGDVIVKIIETGVDYYVIKCWTPGQKKLILTVYSLK